MTPAKASALLATLATERLILEPITGLHADALFAPMQDERIYRWISATPPSSVERLRQFWNAAASSAALGTEATLIWAVRRRDGTYVGTLDAEVDENDVAGHVGYVFFAPFWGHGYATEAVCGLVSHLAGLGVAEFHALVTRGNNASGRVLAKAGSVLERVIPDNDIIRGVSFDDLEYVRRGSGNRPDRPGSAGSSAH